MNMLPYSGFPALPDKTEDMHAQLVALGLNDVEALTARIKKCEDWVDAVEETELTGNPVVFQNALAVPAKSLTATLNPIQDLHGYDHPWAGGADLQQLPPEIGIVAGDESITITENSDGSYTITASETVESTIVNDAAISLPVGDYAINAFNTAKEAQIYIMDSASAVVGNISLDTANVSGIFTSANAITKFRLRLLSGFSGSLTIKPMIVTGLTAPTSYCPYSNICPISGRTETSVTTTNEDESESSSVTIQLGQTVYGGKIKSENGTTKLTVMYKSANLGDYTWEYKTAGYFDGTLSDVDNTIKRGTTANDLIGLLCSQYPEDTSNHLYNQAADNIIASRYTNGHIWVRDTSKGTNPTTFKTAMSGVQICYPLATPIELTLTPAQLQMLKGYNSVSSDDASSLTVTAYTGGPWESITRAIKKVTNKTKTTKKRRK